MKTRAPAPRIQRCEERGSLRLRRAARPCVVMIPAPASRRPSRPSGSSRSRAFTLIEILCVLAIGGVIAAMAAFALRPTGQISTAARMLSNVMSVARSEAIGRRTMVQLRVARRWAGSSAADREGNLRQFSVWALREDAAGVRRYVQIGKWETLPVGVVIDEDPSMARYTFPPGGVPGTSAFAAGLANAVTAEQMGGRQLDYVWIQFDPSGAVVFPKASASLPMGRVAFVLAPGTVDGTGTAGLRPDPAEYAVVGVATLTGRVFSLLP